MKTIRFLPGLIALFFLTGGARAANMTYQVASNAHFELTFTNTGAELKNLEIEANNGHWKHSTADPTNGGGNVYIFDFPIKHYLWTELLLHFTPSADGVVELKLSGPAEEQSPGVPIREEVLWDGIDVTGTSLTNGDFEIFTGNRPNNWLSDGGVANAGPMPAFSGRNFARTSFNRTLKTPLPVKAGVPVNLRLLSRSSPPPTFHDMRAIHDENNDAQRVAKMFLHGANLGNFLEVPPDQHWSVNYTIEDLDHIQAEGFDHVRIPVTWNSYTGPGPDFKLSDDIFMKADLMVTNALNRGLNVLLNMHHFDEFNKDPAGQSEKFFAIWRQIAQHYAALPNNLAFELINEPTDNATTEVMNPIYARAIKEVHTIARTHTIFVGPGRWNSIEELGKLRLPYEDANIIVTVHCYDPFYFTHQSATWAGGDVKALKGIIFPGPPTTPYEPSADVTNAWVKKWISNYNNKPTESNPSSAIAFRNKLRNAKEWGEFYGRPMYVGEFGAYEKADPASRVKFYSAFRQTAEDFHLGWAIWDWKAGFKYWDDQKKQALPGMHEALFGKK